MMREDGSLASVNCSHAEKGIQPMTVSNRILRLNAVLDRTGLSRSTLYRKIGEGTFPRQIQISKRCAGWREAAIEQWLMDPICYSVDDTPHV
jgi:prophage regulatory protein